MAGRVRLVVRDLALHQQTAVARNGVQEILDFVIQLRYGINRCHNGFTLYCVGKRRYSTDSLSVCVGFSVQSCREHRHAHGVIARERRLGKARRRCRSASPCARCALEPVANAVIKATEQAKERYDVPVLCAGGVMASQVIRARMEKRFGSGVSFAEPTLSGDNAVGVAVLAARLYRKTDADGQ